MCAFPAKAECVSVTPETKRLTIATDGVKSFTVDYRPDMTAVSEHGEHYMIDVHTRIYREHFNLVQGYMGDVGSGYDMVYTPDFDFDPADGRLVSVHAVMEGKVMVPKKGPTLMTIALDQTLQGKGPGQVTIAGCDYPVMRVEQTQRFLDGPMQGKVLRTMDYYSMPFRATLKRVALLEGGEEKTLFEAREITIDR